MDRRRVRLRPRAWGRNASSPLESSSSGGSSNSLPVMCVLSISETSDCWGETAVAVWVPSVGVEPTTPAKDRLSGCTDGPESSEAASARLRVGRRVPSLIGSEADGRGEGGRRLLSRVMGCRSREAGSPGGVSPRGDPASGEDSPLPSGADAAESSTSGAGASVGVGGTPRGEAEPLRGSDGVSRGVREAARAGGEASLGEGEALRGVLGTL